MFCQTYRLWYKTEPNGSDQNQTGGPSVSYKISVSKPHRLLMTHFLIKVPSR